MINIEKWYLKQPKESGVYYKCHEPVIWEDSKESCGSEEVKKNE